MTDWLVIVLFNLPPYAGDVETPCERWDRMTIVAQALDDAASRLTCDLPYASTKRRTCAPTWPLERKRELILWGVTLGWWETRFARHVHEGNCRPEECDAHVWRDVHGRVLRVEHRARSPWQIQRHSLTEPVWAGAEGAGLTETTKAAWGALRVVTATRCGSPLGIVSGYMRGGWCRPTERLLPHALERVRWHSRLVSGQLPELRVTSRPTCGTNDEAPAEVARASSD